MHYKKISIKQSSLEMNLSAFLSEYSNIYCHITYALDVWHISYEGIGDN